MSPLETAAKRGLPGSGPPLTARLASRAVEGCVLKLICLVAWSQNEVYPVRRLTNVPPGNSRKARFARFWAASDCETRFSSSRRLRSQADLSGRLEPKPGLSGSEAYGCPPGTAAKRGLPGSG